MADEAHISVVVAYHCAQQVRESSMKTHPLKAEVWPLVSSRAYQGVFNYLCIRLLFERIDA